MRVSAIIAAAVLGIGLAIVPSTAHAATNCSYGNSGLNGSYARCATGTYRAVDFCRYYISATHVYAYDIEVGNTVSNGVTSYANCLAGWSRYGTGIDIFA